MPHVPTSSVEVVGVGAATLDDFWLVDDFSEEERVSLSNGHLSDGGGPVATALCVLAHLGHRCALIDRRGDDITGTVVAQDLAKAGIHQNSLQIAFGATSARAVILVRKRDGARQIIYAPSTANEPTWGTGEAQLLQNARLLHLNGRHETTAYAAVKCAQELEVTISFDGGAGRYREALRGLVSASHIRIVARDFGRQFSGTNDLASMIASLCQPPAQLVVITDGIRGSYVALPDGSFIHQPAYPASPLVDTTGCGDVYHGAFLHGWLSGWAPSRCAEFASRMATRNAKGLGGRFCLHTPAFNIAGKKT